MEILIVTLLVCIILGISYVYFRRNIEKKKELEAQKSRLHHDFYKHEINEIGLLQLAGIGNDKNSDFEFKQAVKKIKLPTELRVEIYDED